MDIQTVDFDTQDHPATEPQPGLSRIFLKRLLKKLAATLAVDAQEDPEEFAEEWEAARELFFSLQPRTPLEAVLAARAVAACNANMDMYGRAAAPGASTEQAQRIRASATAAARSFDTAIRTLKKEQGAQDKPAPRRAPAAARAAQPEQPVQPVPVPQHEFFQPRDRHGNPIPDWRHEWMTMAQRRAAYCYPRNPDLEALAVAEEEKMIAEQAAEDAAHQAANPDAAPGAS